MATKTVPARTSPTPTTTVGQATTTPTGAGGQVLFDPTYPSSGDSTAVPATGWHTAQVPSDQGVPQDSRVAFTAPPGSPGDPNFPSGNVVRFQLDPYYTSPGVADGDVTDTGGYLANRVEIYGRYAGRDVPASEWPDPVGSIRWYSFSIYLPVGFPTATSYKNWFDFTQWKGLNSGSPPVAMSIAGNRFVLGGQHSDADLGPIVPGTWTHFVVGLDFSDSASTGWATVYVNGQLVVDQQPTQTMNDATVDGVTGVDPNYLKMGIYRSKTWTSTQVIYLTPMVIGTTYASVSSPAPSASIRTAGSRRPVWSGAGPRRRDRNSAGAASTRTASSRRRARR
ncbi:MAG TPA: heparin lyase I family protein [Solirubrobacteraceae bacterium]|nr:heparin lyase I family protein [Solirubrobacteraceae bacterium]